MLQARGEPGKDSADVPTASGVAAEQGPLAETWTQGPIAGWASTSEVSGVSLNPSPPTSLG